MADPIPYERDYSFSDYQSNNPSQPLPGPQVDNELENIEQAISGLVGAVKDVRRSDGKLKNEIVTMDSLHPVVKAGVGQGAVETLEQAHEAAAAAAQSASAAASSAGAAAGSAGTAATSAGQAMGFRNAAQTARDLADTARTGAQTARDFAAQWASAPGGQIVNDELNDPGYSARHWALVAEGAAEGNLPDGAVTEVKLAPAVAGKLNQVKAMPDRSSMSSVLSTPDDPEWLYENFPPPDVSNHGNSLFGAGIKDAGGANFVRNTVVGSMAMTKTVRAERNDVFGQGALRHAKYAERITVVGSLAMQWLGSNPTEDPSGKLWHHDYLWNSGVPISDPAWDAWGLETFNPGIRARIAAWDSWATQTGDVAYNVGMGRDALVQMVKGTSNTGIGYRALGGTFEGSDNTGIGDNALFSNVFGNQNTAIGKSAGFRHQEGDANFYGGRNAGISHVKGSANVIIGNNAGNNGSATQGWTGDWNILIGQDAGRLTDQTMPSTLNNAFIVQSRYTRAPTVAADMATRRMGINTPFAELRSAFGVNVGTSGYPAGVVGNETGAILVEGATHTGMLVLTPATSIGALYFGSPVDVQRAGLSYNHAADQGRFRVKGANRFIFDANFLNIAAETAANAALNMNGTQVVGTRKTGWAAATGTATRTTFATSTVTTAQLAERVKALIDDLMAHGLIGA